MLFAHGLHEVVFDCLCMCASLHARRSGLSGLDLVENILLATFFFFFLTGTCNWRGCWARGLIAVLSTMGENIVGGAPLCDLVS